MTSKVVNRVPVVGVAANFDSVAFLSVDLFRQALTSMPLRWSHAGTETEATDAALGLRRIAGGGAV